MHLSWAKQVYFAPGVTLVSLDRAQPDGAHELAARFTGVTRLAISISVLPDMQPVNSKIWQHAL